MPVELWLNFTDEKGEPKRILVEGEKFAIGRTPDNDLQIPVSNLSRQHAQIQRFADVFVISDLGSSNGTKLNDEDLEKPIGLKNGDKLDLGGLEMEVEIVSDKAGADNKQGGGSGGNSNSANDEDEEQESRATTASTAAAGASASNSRSESSLSPLIFIAAPIFGVIILLLLGGLFLISRGNNGTDIGKTNKNNDFIRISNKEGNNDRPTNDDIGNLGKNETPTNSTPPTNNTNVPPTPISTEETPVTPAPTSEIVKIEKSANSFLRRIGKNDPNAFLTSTQVSLVSSRITPFRNSRGLADNIRNAKKNAAQLQSLAASKGFKPQFLVNAALTKLGDQPGDVLATAQGMLEQLSAINQPFGSENADETLLIIAAYSNNTSGESLQSAAAILTSQNNNSPKKVSPRTIRSIWYFKENGKLSEAQFDYALRFLAIGTITQNPKDFNVQAEALTF